MRSRNVRYAVIIVLITLLGGNDLLAQYSIRPPKQKRDWACFLKAQRPWTVDLTLWLPGFSGEFVYGEMTFTGADGADPGNPTDPSDDISGKFPKIFTQNWQQKLFLVPRITYEKERFLMQLDASTGTAGRSVKFNYNNQEVTTAELNPLLLKFYLGHRFAYARSVSYFFKYKLFGYLGARYQHHNVSATYNDGGEQLDITPGWVEPVIGLQNHFTFRRWLLVLGADYGGYIVQQRHTWHFQSQLLFRIGRALSLKAGWDYMKLNQVRTYDSRELEMKLTLSGPSLGFIVHF